jgi:hypothetical protein
LHAGIVGREINQQLEWEFLSLLLPRELAIPAEVTPPFRGWLSGYEEVIANRLDFPSTLPLSPQAGEGSSDDDYMQSSRITAK